MVGQKCSNSAQFLRYSEKYSSQQIKAWVIFFIILHDYGKFDIRFQRKAESVWRVLQGEAEKESGLSIIDSKSYDHGSAGLYWFAEDKDKDKVKVKRMAVSLCMLCRLEHGLVKHVHAHHQKSFCGQHIACFKKSISCNFILNSLFLHTFS